MTDDRLTDDKLDEIEKRAERATEGPWDYGDDALIAQQISGDVKYSQWLLHKDGEPIVHVRIDHYKYIGGAPPGDHVLKREDAEFIAHARQDVPRLIEEVRRLRAKIEEESDDE